MADSATLDLGLDLALGSAFTSQGIMQTIWLQLVEDLPARPPELVLWCDGQPFPDLCNFIAWCIGDPQHGALRHILVSANLRDELNQLVDLCARRCVDTTEWAALMERIKAAALSGAGGSEGRAADAAFAFTRGFTEVKPSWFSTGIRKMLRLTNATTMYEKLVPPHSAPV